MNYYAVDLYLMDSVCVCVSACVCVGVCLCVCYACIYVRMCVGGDVIMFECTVCVV